jgi:hypothetical protein
MTELEQRSLLYLNLLVDAAGNAGMVYEEFDESLKELVNPVYNCFCHKGGELLVRHSCKISDYEDKDEAVEQARCGLIKLMLQLGGEKALTFQGWSKNIKRPSDANT